MFTVRELIEKIEWEGGVAEAIRYGISAKDVPEELRPMWEKLEKALYLEDEIMEWLAYKDY